MPWLRRGGGGWTLESKNPKVMSSFPSPSSNDQFSLSSQYRLLDRRVDAWPRMTDGLLSVPRVSQIRRVRLGYNSGKEKNRESIQAGTGLKERCT